MEGNNAMGNRLDDSPGKNNRNNQLDMERRQTELKKKLAEEEKDKKRRAEEKERKRVMKIEMTKNENE